MVILLTKKQDKLFNVFRVTYAEKREENNNSKSKNVSSLKTTYAAFEDESSNSSKEESLKNSNVKE